MCVCVCVCVLGILGDVILGADAAAESWWSCSPASAAQQVERFVQKAQNETPKSKKLNAFRVFLNLNVSK